MFDPNYPANNSPATAADMRLQLNALKALIDALAAQLAAQVAVLQATQVPIGGVIAWFKDTPGVPPMPANFVECNGQQLVDAASPLDGQFMPDLNTGIQRFIRGALVSGVTGGIDAFATALADNSGLGTPATVVTPDFSPGAIPIPPFVTAVFIIRVK